MSPSEEIYELLYNKLRLRDEDIKRVMENNIYLNKVIAADVLDTIKIFGNLGLEDREIAQIAIQNPMILTESYERIDYLKRFYRIVELTDYKELLIKQPIAMSVNPGDVKQLIEHFQKQGKTNEEIRNILINKLTKYISL